MKKTRQEQEERMRNALAMLERAKTGGATTGAGDGPVDPFYAIGSAIWSLRNALGLTDQPQKHAQGCPCPTCISDGPTHSNEPQGLTPQP